MITHVISLTDGTEIASGLNSDPVHLRQVEIQRTVNAGDDLTLGSVCAACMTATLITPGGNLSLNLAEESAIRVYAVDENGTRKNEGQFVLTKPTRSSQNTYKLTAYDNISKLDTNLADWVNGLTGWPYSLFRFTQMVCTACGLTLVNESLPNGASIQIQQFTLEAVTGRQLISYLAEACGMFVRSTLVGNVEFGWYALRSDAAIAPSQGAGIIPYLANSLSYEDYSVAPIRRVVIYRADGTKIEKVPSGFSGDASTLNTYQVMDNAVLSAMSDAAVQTVAATIYDRLASFTYTPAKCKLWPNSGVATGDLIDVTDSNGVTIRTAIMSITITGTETVESTGAASRQTAEAMNSDSYQQQVKQIMSDEKLKAELIKEMVDYLDEDLICKFG